MTPAHAEVRENRHSAAEIKFLVDPEKADQIRAWARKRLEADPFAAGDTGDLYQTTSLYFDTKKFEVYHKKGSFGRSKYRIRRYNSSDLVFLERKLKTRDLVSKRRTIVPASELSRLNGTASQNGWDGSWFHRRLEARELRPICQISYLRTARVSMTDNGPMRLTVDEDLRAWNIGGLAFEDSGAGKVVLKEQRILELKFRAAMPGLFKELLEEFSLSPETVSKYRLAATALGLVPETAVHAKQLAQPAETHA